MRALLSCCFALSLPLAAAAQTPTRPAITGIAFARFYTSDPASAQRFYGDTLGYTQHDLPNQWVYPVNSLQWIEVLKTPPPKPNERMAAVAFTTRDAPALARYLAAHDVAIEQPLNSRPSPGSSLSVTPKATSSSSSRRAQAHSDGHSGVTKSPRATSTRIIHVGFIVQDRDAKTSSGSDILGFRPYWFGGRQTIASTGSASRSPTAPIGSSTCSTSRPTPTSTTTA